MKKKRVVRAFYLVMILFLLFPTPLTVQAGDPSDPRQKASAIGDAGAVATEHPDASEAAIKIMKQGGNAVDAAIAAAAVQSVTRPFSGGLGGGGIMNIYLKEEDKFVILDHRSESSENFGPEAFIDPETGLVYSEAKRISSGMATAIPGAVKAWEEAIETYGNLSLAEVLEPAIQIAEEGFRADENYVRETRENAERFKQFSSTKAIYLDGEGKAPEVGSLMKNPDMAKTFRLIAEHGSKIFYEGEIAEAIVDTLQNPPVVNPDKYDILAGNMTLKDLKEYEVIKNEPTHSTYRGYDIYSTPPSSSGGTTLGEILNILEPYQIGELPYTKAMHYYLEATRFAFADRREYLGDNRYTAIPVDGLLSKGYAAERRQLISDSQAAIGQVAPGNPWPYDENPDLMPEVPEENEIVFHYDFEGEDGSEWDSHKFGRIDTGTRTSPNDTQFTIENNSGKIRLNERQVGRGSAYGRATPNMVAIKDGELLMKFKFKDLGGDHRARIWMNADVWGSGSTMPANGYGVEVNAKTNQASLILRKQSSSSTLTSIDANLTSDWQMLRFRVHENSLAVKLWPEDETEPKTWQIHEELSESQSLDQAYGSFLFSLINFDYDTSNEFYIDEITIKDLSETELEPIEPEIPEEPEVPVDHSFSYDFKGEIGGPWDQNKFSTIDEGVSFDLSEEGGRISFNHPAEGYSTSFGKAEAKVEKLKDSEVSFRIKGRDFHGNKRLRLWLRANDWSSARSTYVDNGLGIEVNTNNSSITLSERTQGSAVTLERLETDVAFDDWTWIKLRVEGEEVKLKIWEDGAPEPETWTAESKVTNITEAGASLLGFNDLAPNNQGQLYIKDFQIKDLDFEKADQTGLQEGTGDESTIHLSVADPDGNIVAYTTTIVSIGGNGMVVPGYGFLLNNALYGRTPYQSPNHPNYPKPRYRSLSSMTPTIIMKDGKPVMTTGAPGSDTIITTVTQIILNHLEFGMTLAEAIEAPRISQRNNIDGKAQYEAIHLDRYGNLLTELEKMGHTFKADNRIQGIGSATGISFTEDGIMEAAAEPLRRGGGSAMAFNREDLEESSPDKTELEEKVTEIEEENLEEGDYTEESWNKFLNALEKAKEILNKEAATAEEIQQALAALEEAYQNLKKLENPIEENLEEDEESKEASEQADPKDPDPEAKGKDSEYSQETDGASLPKTATNMFNYLLMGGVMFLAGLGIFLYRRWALNH